MKIYVLNTGIDIEIFVPTYVYTGNEGWKTVSKYFLIFVVHTGYHNHKSLGIAWTLSILRQKKGRIISTISEQMAMTSGLRESLVQMDIPWPREIVVYNDFDCHNNNAYVESIICHIVDEGDYEKIKGAI